MEISTAEFVISNSDVEKCPAPRLPEYAFIGRSNVGKSSLINMLTRRAKLAKTSGRPGKTQLINHFLINKNWFLVDLPGYGFARASKEQKSVFGQIITDYIANRTNLMNLFVLIDIRLEPQAIDLNFFRWLGTNGIPFVIVFTKSDKLSHNQLQSSLARYKRTLQEEWEVFPTHFVTSSETSLGSDEILKFISQTNTLFTSY